MCAQEAVSYTCFLKRDLQQHTVKSPLHIILEKYIETYMTRGVTLPKIGENLDHFGHEWGRHGSPRADIKPGRSHEPQERF